MIIAVCNQKGGIGKTTTAVSLATGLRKVGKKTLLVDMDSQVNATDTYRAKMDNTGTLYDLMVHGDSDVIQHTELGDIIAGDRLLKDADKQITGPSANFRVRKVLEKIKGDYDYIILDTPPALSVLLINALTAADKCIIPLTADRYGLHGLTALKENIDDVREYTNPKISVMGILLVKFGGRLKTEQAVLEGLDEYAGMFGTKVFDAKIRQANAVQKAQLARQGIFEYAPDCTAAEDYMELIEEILREE
jgi:chromosome partitioning protein